MPVTWLLTRDDRPGYRYALAFDRLRAASLHPDDSVQLIEQAVSTLT